MPGQLLASAQMRGHYHTDSQRCDQDEQIENLLPPETHAALDQTLQLAEGDGAAAERDCADDAADHSEGGRSVALRLPPVEFDRSDGRCGAAAHAVIERDHLRHVGHGDPLAAPPRQAAADQDCQPDEGIIRHARIGQRDDGGHEHSGAGPQDAAARRDRRAHALQAENEQDRGDEIARLNQ